MKPAAIREGAAYSNQDKAELRRVLSLTMPAGEPSAYSRRQMRVEFQWPSAKIGFVSLGTFARWATREATPEEVAEHFPEGRP